MDRADVEALYDRMKERAERAARLVVKDDAIVNDAVGHALEKVWERRDSLDRARVLSWVGTVAHRKALDEVRRRGRHDVLSASSETSREARWQKRLRVLRSPFTPTDVAALHVATQAALDLLPERQAGALRLHLDGMTGSDIAERLGISQAAAKKRIHDAKENLRLALGDDFDALLPRQRDW